MTPDRQALAAAIERRTHFADALARIQAAREPARQRNREAELALETAEQALREAAEPRALVDALIGGQNITTDAVALNNAVSAATEAVDLARRVSSALSMREDESQADLDRAAAACREAAARVARNSAEVADLMSALDDARHTVATIQSIAATILNVFPPNWDAQPRFDNAEASAAVNPWRAALAALENDADAPIPTGFGASAPDAASPSLRAGQPGGSSSVRPATRPAGGNGRAAA